MSTDTDRPQISVHSGGLYSYTDQHGKTHVSPSYRGLLQELETDTQAADRATAQQDAWEQEQTDRMVAGAARLADLEPRHTAAVADRNTAWEAFSAAALDSVIDAYARFYLAHRRADTLRYQTADARHEAQHGQERRAGTEATPPSLATALDQIARSRIAELQSQTAG